MQNSPRIDDELDQAYAYYQKGEIGSSLNILHSLVKRPGLSKPNRTNIHFLLGQCYAAMRDADRAIQHFQKCIKTFPTHIGYVELAKFYRQVGLYQRSVMCYQKGMQIKPDQINDYMGLAATYRKMYDDASAVKAYRKIIRLDPTFAKAYRNMGLCMRYTDINHEDVAAIKNLLENPNISESDQSQCHYALAKIYNDCDEYELTFKHIQLANHLRGKEGGFDETEHRRRIINQKQTFTKEFFQNQRVNGSDSTLPVFIVGISRAGKTLVERMLCQHEKIYDKEELAAFNKIMHGYVDIAAPHDYENMIKDRLDQKTVDNICDHYLSELTQCVNRPVQYITDTTPCNYRYLGLIHMLFPQAKIILCHRNPLDHALQVYFKYYKKGHRFTYDLEMLGRYFSLYLDIMEHWRQVLGDQVLNIQYEDMIHTPQMIQAKLFEYLQLTAPKQTDKGLLSLDDREINRWQHFENELKPIIKVLKK